MAQEELLDHAEFWLPSQFLTDHDIIMDFSPRFYNNNNNNNIKDSFGSGSGSDLSTETEESDHEDDLPPPPPPPPPCFLHSKGWNLSSSPQSTLCGCVGKEDGSSQGSASGPVTPPPTAEEDGGATRDLLHKAAREVALIKFKTEKTTRAGTGFFDCSNNRLISCPPPPKTTISTNAFSFPPLSHMQQLKQQQLMKSKINMVTSKNKNSNNSNNRPLGLPASAWPPLQAHNQPNSSLFTGQNGSKRETIGTGVFLPRQVITPVETRKKPDQVNATKTRSGKNNSNSQQQRRNSRQPTTNKIDIRLPQDWDY